VNESFLHADFLQVNLKQKISVEIPVEIVGESPAVKAGLGTVVQYVNEIEVEALPTDLPDKFEIDISALDKVDSEIKTSNLKIDKDKIKLEEEEDRIIVKVEPLREEEEEPAPVSEEESVEGEEEKPEEAEGKVKPEGKEEIETSEKKEE
jgi:large subunit ribosomal protein L25